MGRIESRVVSPVAGAGGVVGGTGALNQIAVWSGAASIGGSAGLTYNGTTLAVTGAQTVSGTLSVAGITSFTGGTASSSTTTGQLVVTGGVGVSAAVYVGSFIGVGGGTLATAGEIRIGNNQNGVQFRNAANSANLAVYVDASNNLRYTGNAFVSSGGVVAQDTSDASSATTGSLQAAGGFGLAKIAYLGASGHTGTHIFNGQVTQVFPTAGTAAQYFLQHSDTVNAASHSIYKVSTGGSSAGDPKMQFIIAGVRDYSIGIDNSDSDIFKISASSALETTTGFQMDTAGAVTIPIQLIAKGTATNDNAAAGYFGEAVRSQVNATNAGTTATWTNLTSISLTAGDWDVSALVEVINNGATVTTTGYAAIAISINSGATTTDQVKGDNEAGFAGPTAAASDRSGVIPSYRLSLSATTTVYLKTIIPYTAGTPQMAGRISARRMR